MIILGIDPGIATTGFGVLKTDNGKISALDFGWIKTFKENDSGQRLTQIHKEMRAIIKKHQPDILAIERLFFFMNAKTAMGVAEAIGVIKLAAASLKIKVVDFAPLDIKLTVCGNGRAKKNQVKKTIRAILNVRSPNKKKTHFDDLADALAIAICYAKKSSLINSEKKI